VSSTESPTARRHCNKNVQRRLVIMQSVQVQSTTQQQQEAKQPQTSHTALSVVAKLVLS